MGVAEIRPGHEDTVGKLVESGLEDTLSAISRQAVSMQHAIDGLDRSVQVEPKRRVSTQPRRLETPIVGTPALSAGAVAGGQRGGFVQEEQLRVASGSHGEAPTVLEGEHAGDPGSIAPDVMADEAAAGIVQEPTIAHESSAR